MPAIPQYESQVSASQGLPTPGAPVNQMGDALQDLGEGFNRLAWGLQQREDEDARLWAATASEQAALDGQGIFDNARTTAVPGAKGFTPAVLKQWDEYSAKAEKNAPNDRARAYYKAEMQRQRTRLGQMAMQYEAGETVRFRTESLSGLADTAAKNVYADPATAEDRMGKVVSEIQSTSGIDPEERARLREYARGTIAWQAVTGQIDQGGKPEGAMWNLLTADEQAKARNYFDQKQNELKTENQAAQFIGIAQGVVGGAALGPGDLLDVPAAKAAARAQAGPLEADDALRLDNYIEAMAADRERQAQRERAGKMAAIVEQIDRSGGDLMHARVAAPSLFTGLSGEETANINTYAGQVATGMTRETRWDVYNSLINDPATLAQTNLAALKPMMNGRELATLERTQQQLLDDPVFEQNLRENATILNEKLKKAGYSDSDEAHGRFHALLQQAVDQEGGGKKVTQRRVMEIADDLLVDQVISRGRIWDSKEAPIEMEIPQATRERIRLALESEGLPTDDYAILQAYRKSLP